MELNKRTYLFLILIIIILLISVHMCGTKASDKYLRTRTKHRVKPAVYIDPDSFGTENRPDRGRSKW